MEKRKLNLEDLLPEKPQFMLGGKIFSIRPPNMLDQVWIKRTWGKDFEKILPDEDWPQVARFVYHQLDNVGQTHFRARKARIVNELTGEEAEQFLTAAEVLLEMITDQKEMLGILGAVYRAIAISNPVVEEVVKKKLGEMLEKVEPLPPSQKKSENPIGERSSTRSRTNTGGRKRKSRG